MFKNILIPLDGTTRSEEAMILAQKMAKRNDATITLLGVVKPRPVLVNAYIHRTPPYTSLYQISDRVAGHLHVVAAKARQIVPRTWTVMKFGDPADVIVETAEERDIDLIVMVTHGYAGLDRMISPSVSEKVMRQAPCPVLIVKDGHFPRHILIALDGTEFAETIIEPALALADIVDAEVTFARIEQSNDLITTRDVADLATVDAGLAELVLVNHNNQAKYYLEEIIDRYGLKKGSGVDLKIGYGQPGEQIMALAERYNCDFIAMATHGRRGFNRLLRGSVTENVLHRANKMVNEGMLVWHVAD